MRFVEERGCCRKAYTVIRELAYTVRKNVSKRTRIYRVVVAAGRTLGRDDVDACVDEVVWH